MAHRIQIQHPRDYNYITYFVADDGHVWKGPVSPEDNLHWARMEGRHDITGDPIWVCRRSEPPQLVSVLQYDDIARLYREIRDVQREQARGHLARWRQHEDEIRRLPVCDKPCSGCPFIQDTVAPEVMAEIRERVAGDEEWVCHQTTGEQAELLPSSKRCKGGQQDV